MKDTPDKIEEKMREMMRVKSPLERLEMGCSMFDFSKELVMSAILREHPDITSGELKRELFLKFYGDDFTPSQRKKILQHLAATCH